jgi:FtsZ-interacting cell division protein ZipA
MVETSNEQGRSRTLVYAAAVAALVLIVAAVGFPAGWYSKRKVEVNAAASAPVNETKSETGTPSAPDNAQAEGSSTAETETPADPSGGASNGNALAVRQQQEREREARERALAAQERAGAQAAKQNSPGQPQPTVANAAELKKPETAKPAPKSVTVQVTYDENGRVTQASGGDGMAQRIARQKRFPAGKGGTTTVTIPIN